MSLQLIRAKKIRISEEIEGYRYLKEGLVQTKRKLFITWSKIASDVRMHITVIKNINCEILTVEVE